MKDLRFVKNEYTVTLETLNKSCTELQETLDKLKLDKVMNDEKTINSIHDKVGRMKGINTRIVNNINKLKDL